MVPWTERAPFYRQVRALYHGIFWFLGSIVFALVVLATSNTLAMAVMERVREFGTLRAIGTSIGQVAGLVGLEALWLGLIGALLGDLLGAGLIIDAERAQHLDGAAARRGRPDRASGALRAGGVRRLTSLLMLVVLALAAVGPVLRVARLRIVEALAHT